MIIVAAVQLFNVLDFLMVTPLGPDFAFDIGLPIADFGLLGASYAGAAALAGITGATVLDRIERRRGLALATCGLVIATAAGAFVHDALSMLATRLVAGFFGGPATALSQSLIADTIPNERRGRAVSIVMTAFSVASTFGVPLLLELSSRTHWRYVFIAVAGLGAVILVCGVPFLPRGEKAPSTPSSVRELFSRPTVWWSLLGSASLMASAFVVIPNLAAYLQFNRSLPRNDLQWVYLAGGVMSFLTLSIGGRFIDQLGPAKVAVLGTILFAGIWFAELSGAVPVAVFFVCFLMANTLRNVASQTLASQVPRADQRARFMASQNAVQHVGSAAGAYSSSLILSPLPGERIGNVPMLAACAVGLALLLPPLLQLVQRDVSGSRGA